MKVAKFIILTIVLFLCMGMVSADDGNFTVLQEEILAAESSNNNLVLSKNYTMNSNDLFYGVAISNHNFVLDGNGKTLNGNNISGIIQVFGNNVTIKNLKITNSRGYMGAAVISSADNLTFYNCIFENNTLDKYNSDNGGAIYAIGSLNVYNSTFINNKAPEGGAINSLSSAFIYNCNFINNSGDNGGVIFTEGNLNIINSNFINNQAIRGGAIYSFKNNIIKITNSNFINNLASDDGGAIYSYFGFTVDSSNFTSNHATNDGGAIFTRSGVSIISSIFINNKASIGGAVYATGGFSSLNSIFDSNSATSNGGAIYVYGSLSSSGSIFINNKAPEGGAIYNEGSSDFLSSNFTNNSATNGGVFYLIGTISVTSGFFKNNKASYGSLLFTDSGKNININYNVILDNNPIHISNSNNVNLDYNWWGTNNIINKIFTQNTNFTLKNYYILEIIGLNISNKIVGENFTYSYGLFLNGTHNNDNISKLPHFLVAHYNNNKFVYYDGRNSGIINAEVLDFNNTFTAISNDVKFIGFSFNTKTIIKLKGSNIVMYYKNGTRYVVYLTDHNGKGIANTNVTITLNNNPNIRMTDSEGMVSLALNLNPGNYTAKVHVNDLKLDVEDITTTITILPNLFVNNLVKIYKNASQLNIIVLDNVGSLVKNTVVTININGVFYNRTTNDDGIAILSINLAPGKYIATVHHPLSDLMASSNVTILSSVLVNDLEKFFKNESQLQIKILDDQGNPIKNTEIDININGAFYTRRTNDNGIAILSINLAPGKYIATAIHPINKLMASSNVNVKSTLIGSDLNKQFGQDGFYEIRVFDGRGNPLKNQKVEININGVFYERYSDDNFIARLNINLGPGSYIATVTWNGLSTSNIITVNE